MRPLVARHQHDRDLVVRPGARADAGVLAHRAEAAFGRGDQARREAPAALQRELGAVGVARWSRAPRRARPARPAGRPASRRSRAARRKRFSTIQPIGAASSRPRRPPRGDRNAGTAGSAGRRGRRRRCGCRGSARPGSASSSQTPSACEQALAGIGDGRGAAVEARLGEGLRAARGRSGRCCRPASPAASASRLPFRPAPTTARSNRSLSMRHRWQPPGLAATAAAAADPRQRPANRHLQPIGTHLAAVRSAIGAMPNGGWQQ